MFPGGSKKLWSKRNTRSDLILLVIRFCLTTYEAKSGSRAVAAGAGLGRGRAEAAALCWQGVWEGGRDEAAIEKRSKSVGEAQGTVRTLFVCLTRS